MLPQEQLDQQEQIYHLNSLLLFFDDQYYESSEIPKPDITDFYDAIDEVWEIVDKQKI